MIEGPTEPRPLHIITGLGTGGAEMMLYNLFAARPSLVGQGVVSLTDKGTIGPRMERIGVPVRALGMPAGLRAAATLGRVRKVLGKADADVHVAWLYHANFAVSLMAPRRNRVPVVWNVLNCLDGVSVEKRLTAAIVGWSRRLSERADIIVYNSDLSRRQHEAFGFAAARSRVIPNGFDTARFKPDAEVRARVRHELGIAEDQVAVMSAARFHPLKGHAALFEAAGLVHARHPRAVFVAAGRGVTEANPAVAAMVERSGLGGAVRLLGDRADIPALLAASDMFVQPSVSEAFPNAPGEAMATGLVCVATDVGDTAILLGDTGFLVKPGDPAALAAAVERAITLPPDERHRMGQRARERIVREFPIDGIADRFAQLIRELSAQRTR